MGKVGADCGFWFSFHGILKMVEFIFSLLILILTSASNYTFTYIFIPANGPPQYTLPTGQMAYVNFVGSFCCITLLISAVIYSLKFYNLPLCGKLPWKKLEMFFAIGCALLNVVAMAVAANSSAGSALPAGVSFDRDHHGLYAAVAVFCTVVFLVFGFQAFMLFRGSEIRSHQSTRRGRNEEVNVST